SNTSGSSLFLLWFLGTEGPEHRSVPLVKLGKRLNVIQPDGLNARGNTAEEEDEDLSEEQEDEPNDRYQHVVLNDQAVKNQRIERSRNGRFCDSNPGKPQIREKVRQESADLERCNRGFDEAQERTKDQDQRNQWNAYVENVTEPERLRNSREPT